MALEIKTSLRTTQQLQLSPQVQQALKILMLNRLELESEIASELRENPVLEEIPNGVNEQMLQEPEEPPLPTEGLAQLEAELNKTLDAHRDADELFERLTDSITTSDEVMASNTDSRETPAYEVMNCQSSTLYEDLIEQLHMAHLTPYELECALLLVEYLDENGFLPTSLEEIAEEHALDMEDLKYALLQLQECDPPGVGARSLQECLLLQLRNLKKVPPFAEKILVECWSEFERQDITKIARALKAQPAEITRAMRFIRTNLDPRPARQYVSVVNQAVIPDVYVFKREGQWVVSINEDGLPRLRISKKYEALLEELNAANGKEGRAKLKTFLNGKVKSAKAVMRALSERNRTILRVTECILEKQKDFFEMGLDHLRPLVLKEIAEELSLAESTISRTTSNKYLHCPRGTFELKYFFNAGLSRDHGNGIAAANETVKNWVAEYIRGESPEHVLSDQEIADLIAKEKSIKVARRTVAKYRESLGILPSSKRAKRYVG